MTALQLGVLRIKVTILDADGSARPVPRHALLISENPTAAAPRRVVTALDGTAEIRLRPGNYTVESDGPLIFQGKAYQWAQTLDVPAGRDTLLELTAGNAQVEAASAVAPAGVRRLRADGAITSALLLDWQNSVVSIWSPTRQGAGFLIDARGLIATNQRLVGAARVGGSAALADREGRGARAGDGRRQETSRFSGSIRRRWRRRAR